MDTQSFDSPNPVADSSDTADSSRVLGRSFEVLEQLLQKNNGVVSSVQLKKELMARLKMVEPEARNLMVGLQILDEATAQLIGKPDAKTYHHGRSFYSKLKYDIDVLTQTDKEADTKEQEAGEAKEEKVLADEAPISRQNRGEEARLGPYVMRLLEDIYASELATKDIKYVFDVHNERAGSTYENVDLIAVHWRSETTVDLVAVEVKLDFSATAVHQACNYTRFANRVWVAAVVKGEGSEAARSLRLINNGLFEYAVSRGLGIIACRRTKGSAYQAVPIHWPRWQNPEPIEREQFLERYRAVFEQAEVLEPEKKRRAARF